MAYNVGEVEVSVFPNAQEFNSRLQGQVGPQADRLGKQIGDQLAQQIAQGIRRGLGDFPSDNPAKDPAKRKGDEAAGAFGDAFKARMKAALADLPDVKIGADSSAADRALAEVRAQMESLRDARIGIDLSDAEAVAKLDELKAKLAEIGASSESVQVKVDTAAASAELAKFQAELDRIDGETATAKVKIDDGGGSGGITSLTSALMAVAPAIVPIGAAALAGGAALGTMAAAGVAGAGVLAIAFKGVGDAVKLLGQQQDQQAAAEASAGAGAAQHAQAVVAAQRQMESAQMSLADAQRSAARQQVSDAQAVKSAQTALGDAQRAAAQRELTDAQAVASAQTALGDARRNAASQQITDAQAVVSAQQSLAQANDQVTLAQKALTDAQEAGRRELESFANNAADAALAQQQAAITLETTQAAAAKTMASSTATDLQKRQAALDVAKAQQSLTEANERVTESAQDNTKAQAAGVAGTQAVTSAQRQVTSAQDAQQRATQGLADAQRKAASDQISAQESIAKAAQALADAQRKAADDQITSRESIAKAAQALTSAEQKAADDQITSHESIVRAQQGVAAAADAMAAAQRQSAGTTNAALDATNKKIAELDPVTRNFAEYLRGTWTPIWKNVQSAAAGGLLPGVQAGLDNLVPVMPGITALVGNLASTMGDLFRQGTAALAGPFWQHFISDIGQVAGPLLSDLAHALGNVAHGFAGIIDAFIPMDVQIGQGLVDLTRKFADWGAGLGQSQGFKDFVAYVQQQWPAIKGIIENVGTAVGHLIQAGGILGGPTLDLLRVFSGVLASLPVGVVVALVGAFEGFKIFQTINKPFGDFADMLGGFAKKTEDAEGGLGKVSKAAGGVASALPVLGAVATVAVAGFTIVSSQMQQTTNDINTWAKALLDGGNAAAQVHQQYLDQFGGKDPDWLGKAAEALGFAASEQDVADKAKQITDAMSPLQRAQQDVTKATNDLSAVMADPNHTYAQAQTAAGNLQVAQYNLQQQQDAVKVSTQNANLALEQLISTQQTQASASLGYDAAILTTQNQIDNYKAHLNDATLSANDHKLAENQVEQSMLNVVEAAKKKADADGAGLSPAQLAQKEVTAQRDALNNLVGQLGYVPPALKGMYDQLNGPQATALANSQTQIDNLKDATKRLGDATNGLPYQHGIAVTADVQAARDAITGLTNDYHNYSINVGLGGKSAYAYADGGVLPGWSPGRDIHTFTSPTGGSLALSGGESIMRPEFTAAVGSGWVNSVNAAAKSGGSSGVRSALGFADGGVWNPWSLVAKVGIDPASLAAAREALLASVQGPAISAGSGGVTWPQLDAIRKQLFPGSVLTSAYRAGAKDYHGLGDAIDIGVPGNLQSGLMPIAATLARLYPNSTELIHNPNGSIKNGRSVPASFWGPATWAEHANHVHWAMTPAATAATRAGLAGGGVPTDPTGNVALGLKLATQRGWGGMAEWSALYKLWERESGWNNVAQNRTSSAYGIPQFLDSTWATVGAHKTSDAAAQIQAGLTYIAQRFRDPIGAWAHEQAVGWYDQGGVVPPGYHMIYNGTGGNEVIAPQQTFQQVVNKMHDDAPGSGRGGSGPAVHIEQATFNDAADIDLLAHQINYRQRAGAFS